MNWVDLAIILVLATAGLVGFLQGALRLVALSIVTAAGVVLAKRYAGPALDALQGLFDDGGNNGPAMVIAIIAMTIVGRHSSIFAGGGCRLFPRATGPTGC